MSERLSLAGRGRAVPPAGSSSPLPSPSPPHHPSAPGLGSALPASSRCSGAVRSRRLGTRAARPLSAATHLGGGARSEPAGDGVQAAAAEPLGAQHLGLGPAAGATPFPAPALQAAGLGGPRGRTFVCPGAWWGVRGTWKMRRELALHPWGPGAVKSTHWLYPATTMRGSGFLALGY